MNTHVRTAVAGTLVALGFFLPFVSTTHAQSYSPVIAQQTTMTEGQRQALLEQLIQQLISVLQQLYPQINWNSVIHSSTNNSGGNSSNSNGNGNNSSNGNSTSNSNSSSSLGIKTDAVAPVGNDAARANFDLTFSISAFGDDIFVKKDATRDNSVQTSSGVTYEIQNGSGDEYTDGSTSDSFESDSESGDTSSYFKISEGDHRTFTLHIALDNSGATSGYYRAKIVGMAFDTNTTAGGEDTITGIFSKAFTSAVYVADHS